MKRVRVACVGIVLAAVVSAPIVAWASHGKAGLWEITVKGGAGARPGMPDMSKMPPEAQARMKAMMGGHIITVRHCVTAADTANDKPNLSHSQDCKMTNEKMTGHTFSADMVCTGKLIGTGHVEATYDTPEHYTSTESMKGTVHGHQVDNSTTMEGRWISADCGNVH